MKDFVRNRSSMSTEFLAVSRRCVGEPAMSEDIVDERQSRKSRSSCETNQLLQFCRQRKIGRIERKSFAIPYTPVSTMRLSEDRVVA